MKGENIAVTRVIGWRTMIEGIKIQRVSDTEFKVSYVDSQKKKDHPEGYSRTEYCRTELEIRVLLGACGVSDGKIDRLFWEAR